mgnify:CR=1 FL=1
MGKKRHRKKYTSKATRVSHNGKLSFDSAQKLAFKIDAWMKGKPVKLTVANKGDTSRPFIRVLASEYWGTYASKKS